MDNKQQLSDASYFFALVWKYKIFICVVTFLAAIVSVIVSFQLPIWYASTVNFVPPKESGSDFTSGTSGVSAVMKNFGLAKIGGSKSNEYSMIVFLQSRAVTDSIIKKYDLAKVYNMPENMMSDVRIIFADNANIEYLDEGNYGITILDIDKHRAANIANDYVEIANYFANKTYQEEMSVNMDYLEKRIKSVDSTIAITSADLAKISKSTLMFAPEEQAKAASIALADIKQKVLEYEIVYDYYKNNFGVNDPQSIAAKEMLDLASDKLKEVYSKSGLIGNITLNEVTSVAVDYATKYADIEALIKTKALLITTLEKIIIDRGKYVDNFFIIDPAIAADKKDKPKRLYIIAGGTLGAFVICILVLLLINSLKSAIRNTKAIENDRKN